jgi:hypothetical protein
MFAANWRASIEECQRVVEQLAAGRTATPRELLQDFAQNRRRHIHLGLVWMAKAGLLDWL